MTNGTVPQQAQARLTRYLDSLPVPGRELTSEDVEAGQQAKRDLLAMGEAAVPALLDALEEPEFLTKDSAFDLLIDLGPTALVALDREAGERSPTTSIWTATVRRHLGQPEALDRIWPLLANPDHSVRHLAAVSLAFQLENPSEQAVRLVPTLIEALDDTERIEGTPFTVAGSALAMLSQLANERFTSEPREVHLYNYEGFVYPPPLHPFPFAADHLTGADPTEQQRIRDRVREWWRHQQAA